jgi:glycosyltransferase involved in cell wall biosynthesis
MRPWKDLKALAAIVRLMREERPDIVHAHTSKAALLARIAARLTRTPIVFSAHTWSFADGAPRLQQWLSIPMERLTGALGGTVIAVSQANVDEALRRKMIRPENLRRIWNGIPDVPLRAKHELREHVTLMMTARFCPQKDHLLLLKALAGVQGSWKMVFAGDGPMRPAAERLAKTLRLADRVRFMGDRDDIHCLLTDADIFVLATRFEGLPLSILEAMRAGLPVIATNVGGVGEMVADGVNGFLTERGNVAQMRDRIQRLISSRELRSSLGQESRRRYEQDFRLDVMLRKTLLVYQEVLVDRQPILGKEINSLKV